MNKNLNTLIHGSGRLVVAFGTFIALACAVAIIKVAPAGLENAAVATPTEVIRLAPVVVTISKERYLAIRAETERPSLFVRLFTKKPTAV